MDIAKPSNDLLSWCALLRTPNAEALTALTGVSLPEARALFESPAFEPHHSPPRLRDEWRHLALASLRQEHPLEEVQRHIAALHFFCERLERLSDHEAESDRDSCIFHLTALHDLSIESMEWTSIIPYINRTRKALTSAQHADWLEFFEAYVALRSNQSQAGWNRLEALRRAELEDALLVRVLHACSLPYADNGQYVEAIQLCEAGLTLARALGDSYREGYLLLSIGIIHNDLEDHQQAVEFCERALGLFRTAGAPGREAHALYELGNNLMRLGEWERARHALDQAEQLFTHFSLTKRLAMTYWAQGVSHLMLGNDERCEDALTRAVTMSRAEDYGVPIAARDALARLGVLYQTQGRFDEAVQHFSEALTIADQYQQRHYRAIYRYRLAEALRLSGRLAEARETYLQALQEVDELRATTEIETLKLSLLGTAQYLFESVVLFELDHGSPAAALAIVERARARALLDLLAGQIEQLPEQVAHPTVTLAEIQSHLPSGALLLEYFTTGVLPLSSHSLHYLREHNPRLLSQLVPQPSIIIFAITHDTCTVHRLTINPNNLWPSSHANDPVLQTIRSTSRMRWLSEQMIRPVEQLIASSRQLYVAPHGPLHFVPFAALRMADQDYVLRADGPSIALIPSATVLIRTCLALPRQRATSGLAIGYNDQSGMPLEYAESEAAWVARLMDGEAWVGSAPKSDRLIAHGAEFGWLHIAGHAAYDEHTSLTFSLQLGHKDALEATRIMAELRLKADLVTLSSCRSGLGRVVQGDELLGLQRAFLYAGVPTVVCTYARTYDTVAFLIMDHFYESLRAGIAIADALRDAQVAVRELSRADAITRLARIGMPLDAGSTSATDRPFAAPEFWATFVLIGRPD